jgi:hypothetical protein
LLGARDNLTYHEYLPENLDLEHTFKVRRGIRNSDAYITVDELKGEDAEGYVLVDKDFNRLKVKSKDYVAKHHLRSSWSLKNAIQVVLNNEVDEVVNYFPEYKEKLIYIDNEIEELVFKILSRYKYAYELPTVKDVGLYLKHDDLPFKHIIFTLYKQGIVPSEDVIRKEVYKIEAYKLVEVCQ